MFSRIELLFVLKVLPGLIFPEDFLDFENGIVQFCIVLFLIVLFLIVLFLIVLFCIVLFFIVLFLIVLFFIVLFCIVLFSLLVLERLQDFLENALVLRKSLVLMPGLIYVLKPRLVLRAVDDRVFLLVVLTDIDSYANPLSDFLSSLTSKSLFSLALRLLLFMDLFHRTTPGVTHLLDRALF